MCTTRTDGDSLKQAFYHGFILGKYHAYEWPTKAFEAWLQTHNNSYDEILNRN